MYYTHLQESLECHFRGVPANNPQSSHVIIMYHVWLEIELVNFKANPLLQVGTIKANVQ